MYRRWCPLLPVVPFVFCDEKDRSFWARSWNHPVGSDPGWHLKHTNHALEMNASKFDVVPQSRVLVPLCGKSVDLVYLMKRSKEVIGVEFVESALHEFSSEHTFSWDVNGIPNFERADAFEGSRAGRYFGTGSRGLGYYLDTKSITPHVFTHENLTILKGDFFEEQLPIVDRIYDRAAFVAIDPARRHQYVDRLDHALMSDGKILLLVIECDMERVVSGPPFAVSESEVRECFPPSKWNVEFISRQPSKTHPRPLKRTDQVCMDDVHYLITKKKGHDLSTITSSYLMPYIAAGGIVGLGAFSLALSKFMNR